LWLTEGAEIYALQFDNEPVFGQDGFFGGSRNFNTVWYYGSRTISGDLRDPDAIKRAVAIAQPDFVFHLAAVSQVTEAHYIPRQTYDINIMGLVNLLEAMRGFNPDVPIVIASSDKAYGEYGDIEGGLAEWMPPNPGHPYDTSKACADMIAQSYAKHYGMKLAIARTGNVFGRGDINWKRIIPGVAQWLCLDEPIIIRSNGKQVREYIGVDSVVWAYLGLMEFLQAGIITRGEIVNFGGVPATPIQLVRGLRAVYGGEFTAGVKVLDEAKDENPAIVLNDDKAAFTLGWYYSEEQFAKDLRDTMRWYEKYFQYDRRREKK
jgi:CDP-glucose 4,6-dehydratase